jgi:hypothetical protein
MPLQLHTTISWRINYDVKTEITIEFLFYFCCTFISSPPNRFNTNPPPKHKIKHFIQVNLLKQSDSLIIIENNNLKLFWKKAIFDQINIYHPWNHLRFYLLFVLVKSNIFKGISSILLFHAGRLQFVETINYTKS